MLKPKPMTGYSSKNDRSERTNENSTAFQRRDQQPEKDVNSEGAATSFSRRGYGAVGIQNDAKKY